MADALCSLLFPFYWQHIYIPLLPAKLLDYLQAPVPFLVGVQADHIGWFPEDPNKLGEDAPMHTFEPPGDCVVIDLDRNAVHNFIDGETTGLYSLVSN